MTTKEFTISGMSCNHCVMAVKKELTKLSGIALTDVKVGAASVAFDETKVSEQQVKDAIQAAGYVVVK